MNKRGFLRAKEKVLRVVWDEDGCQKAGGNDHKDAKKGTAIDRERSKEKFNQGVFSRAFHDAV